jgi:PAS domain S-box-containing protein
VGHDDGLSRRGVGGGKGQAVPTGEGLFCCGAERLTVRGPIVKGARTRERIGRLRRFWRWLTEPAASVQGRERRRHAQLLASLLIALVPLSLAIAAVPPILEPSASVWQDADVVVTLGCSIFWLVAYFLSRAGHYEWAARLAIVTASVVIFVIVAEDATIRDLNYLIMPVLLSGLLLPARDIAVFEIVVGPVSFALIGTAIILLVARHREQLEEDRRAELAESEARYRGLFEAAFEGIAIHEKGRLLDANTGFARMFGYPLSETIGRPVLDFVAGTSRELMVGNMATERPFEALALRKDGTTFHAEMVAKGHTFRGRDVQVVAVRDITAHKEAEEKIRLSLEEKEALLKEIHHRVKNNLQIISSLLSLQSECVDDERSLEVFQDSRYRVRSMALIHEKLYQSGSLARIDLAEYIRSLAAYLFRSYDAYSRGIQCEIKAQSAFLDIDIAVPCGLILNELISNALKHAFADDQEGRILIDFLAADDARFELVIRDDGVGMPQDLDFQNVETLGLQLVFMLVQQLQGTIEVDGNGGTTVKIAFSLTAG